jgi:hypothetical protein
MYLAMRGDMRVTATRLLLLKKVPFWFAARSAWIGDSYLRYGFYYSYQEVVETYSFSLNKYPIAVAGREPLNDTVLSEPIEQGGVDAHARLYLVAIHHHPRVPDRFL